LTTLRWGAVTDTGRVRANNQDTPLAVEGLFAVADGMGGHRGGEVASQVAVRALEDGFLERRAESLLEAVHQANEKVFERAGDDPELRGMGTTLTAVALVHSPDEGDEGDVLVVVNVGDSRTYLFRDNELEQLTEDHSLVEEMVRSGRLTPEEAEGHPQRNIVTRALGIEPEVDVDWLTVAPYAGDRFVLCSDGLFGEVDDGGIAAVLRRLEDPTDAAQELVRLANEGGGRDNITVVVVDVTDDDGKAERASAVVSRPLRAPEKPDLAGFTAAMAVPAPTTPAAAAAPAPASAGAIEQELSRRQRRKATRRQARAERPRRLTWRVAIFVLLFLGVMGAAAAAVGWQARRTFYVGFRDDDVAVFRGKPGGLLWFDPTFEEATGLTRADVPSARLSDVEDGQEVASIDEARRYVDNLRELADRQDGRADDPAGATTTTAVPGDTPPVGSTAPGTTVTTTP